jgi:23S rRNA (pseudouridine1915-N3)-methyltransferase
MRLKLLAAGTRMPRWVREGYEEYASRLRGEFRVELVEIPLSQRTGGDSVRAVRREGERMLAAIDERAWVVALQVDGRSLDTRTVAAFLAERLRDGRDVALCIGGPDGLAREVDARADLRWSLSALTLPHGLVRVIVAEALYRAASMLKGHPYHRA